MRETWIFLALAALFKTDTANKYHLESFYTTLPIPVFKDNHTWIKVMHLSQSATIIDAPQILFDDIYVSIVRYPDLEIQTKRARAADFGIKVNAKREIGEIDREHIKSVGDFLNAQNEYDFLVSLVLEKKWLEGTKHDVQEQRDTAKKLLACWQMLAEDKLMPFYESEGSQFLGWMKRYGSQ